MVDEVLLRRLVYVKLLYTQARERYERGTEIDLALSILTLDNSFENMLWIVLGKRNPTQADELKRKQYPPFQALLNRVKELRKDLDAGTIRELHEARNLIQHSGMTVSRTHTDLYFSKADSALRSLCEEVGVKWEDVSFSMLIRNDLVRGMFKQAEMYFLEKAFLKSAVMMIKALEEAKEDRQLNQFGSMISVLRISADDAVPQDVGNPLRVVVEYAHKIYDDMEVLKLGMDYKGWREYRLPLGTLDPDDDLEDLIAELSKRAGIPTSRLAQAKNKGVKERDLDIDILKASEKDIESWIIKTMPFVLKTILYWEEAEGLFDIGWQKTARGPLHSDEPLVPVEDILDGERGTSENKPHD